MKSSRLIKLISISFLSVSICLSSTAVAQKSAAESKENEFVGFTDLIKTLYQQGYSFAISNYSRQLAESKKKLSSQSYMTTLEVAPYEQSTKVEQAGSGTSDFSAQGLRFSILQATPWGVSLTATADQKKFSAVTAATQIESEKTIGLTVDLWNNVLGLQTKSLDESRVFEARSLEIQSEMERRGACQSAAELALEYWSAFALLEQAKETQKSALMLAKSVEKTKQRGVISQIEYLGAQSELLNTEKDVMSANQRLEQAVRRIVSELRLKPKSEYSQMLLTTEAIENPKNAFAIISDRFLNLKSAESLVQSNTQLVYESRQRIAQAARQAAKPSVQFGFKKVQSNGEIAAVDFSQDDQIMELAFKMNFNDGSTLSSESDANIQLLKAELDYFKARQNTSVALTDLQEQIKTKLASLKLQEKQIGLQAQIKDDYQVRFLQGRINYQDYLRQQQSWSALRMSVVSESVDVWQSVLKSYLSLDIAHNFCENLE